MKKVNNAPLPIHNKFELIFTMCISPLMFYFDNLIFSEKQLDELTTIIVNNVRNWLNLNSSSTRSFFFTPKDKGGLGIPHPRILYYARHLSFYLGILNSSDPSIKALALNSFHLHMEKRKTRRAESIFDTRFAEFLVDEKGNFQKTSKSCWPKSQWQHLSNMCAREGVKVTHNTLMNDEFVFSLKTEANEVQHTNSRAFYNMYKEVKLNEIANEFSSLKSQGRVTREAKGADHKLSLSFMKNNNLKDKIKQFAVKSRLQILECNSLLHTYSPTLHNKKCSLCNHPSDTCSHVLNGCTKLNSFYVERHNRIVNVVFEKLKYHCSKNNMCFFKEKPLTPSLFMFDEGVQFVSNAIKPDIVTIDYEMKEVKIIEISTPFDAFIDSTYQSKFDKYFPLTLEISDFDFTAEIIVLIIGSCGTIHKRFVPGLVKCQIPKYEAKFLAKYCSISSIIGSYRVWKRRCKLFFK